MVVLFLGSTVVALPVVAAYKIKDAYLQSVILSTLGTFYELIKLWKVQWFMLVEQWLVLRVFGVSTFFGVNNATVKTEFRNKMFENVKDAKKLTQFWNCPENCWKLMKALKGSLSTLKARLFEHRLHLNCLSDFSMKCF